MPHAADGSDPEQKPSHWAWSVVVAMLFGILAAAFYFGTGNSRFRRHAATSASTTSTVESDTAAGEASNPDLFKPLPKLEHFTNTIGMSMILVPRRRFHLGTDPAKSAGHPEEAHPDEPYDPNNVVGPFYLADSEVTQTQWNLVMGAGTNPSQWRNDPTDPLLANRPVDNVSWSDAVKFCRRLSVLENRKYRLPSEREWECACRAEDLKNWGQKWCFGDDESKLQEYGNFLDRSNTDDIPYLAAVKNKYNDSADKTCTVKHYKPNRWGFYDMHGNVWEWTSSQTAPLPNELWAVRQQIKEGKVPYDGELYFVLRGGSFIVVPDDCRSANRYGADASSDNVQGDIGFRVALDR